MNGAPQLPPILPPSSSRAHITRRPLHVLTITPFYPTATDESQGCFIAEPLMPLEQLGISSTVLALQPFYRQKARPAKSAIASEWVRYFSVPGARGLPLAGAFAFARMIGRVRDLHRSRPIDVIHAHAPLPSGHAAMLISAELSIPYVVSVHGLDVLSTEQATGSAGKWRRRISQRVYQSSKRVICISEHVRERVLEATAGKSRTSVVYNGVDAELFTPASTEPSIPVVLSVGNLIPIKGHDVLIRAVASLKAEFSEVRLEIIGDGPELASLRNLAAQVQMGDHVHFSGRKSRKDVANAMSHCTVFALPSSFEGLGCVYLEAMACARPVIGCRDQGISEIIQHGSNGFLVGTNNERELGLALGMLLRDAKLRANLGRAARDTILDRLTLATQAEQLARIYRECAS